MSDMNGTRGAIAYEESALKRLASEGWHDRPSAARIIGEALSAAVPSRGSLETYIGDDGETYIFGKES